MVRTVLSHYSEPVLISITQPFSQLARVTTHRVVLHEEDIPLSLLHLDVLGPPEVFHDGNRLTFSLRKALALLVYLAVEGGMHPRSKLAAFLWPDSEPHDARTALRNAVALLRSLLADPDSAPAQHSHLLSEQELLGLNPQVPLELDLDVVQQAYQQAQRLSVVTSEEQRTSLVAHVQHALSLVRGPFLDGFWLREDAPFDEWLLQQQRQWQVRVQLLFDRLSSFQETAGEQEQAKATLLRWLALDPLQEEAYRRLMRVHLALGDPAAALQAYASCQARLAEALQVEPSADIVALAEHIRAVAAGSLRSHPTRPGTAESQSPGELVPPLVGRAAAFRQLVGSFQRARQGQPQAVLVVGEAGIGKTRLAGELVAWAQGAEALSGQALEMGGRLPYQPLVEAVRQRLEEENAPEDLLDDLWLAELSRLLPELRVRYPDLPAPTQDDLTAKIRLFEAVARLLDALAQRAPLVLLLDDLQWVDEASLDLLRYLGGSWTRHGSRVLLLGTVRREDLELNPQLSADLSDLGRDLPVTQVLLQTLSQAETMQLVQAIAGEGAHGTRSGSEQREPDPAGQGISPVQRAERPLVALSDFLFAYTGGQPLYLLETLKLLRERELLVSRLGADGQYRLDTENDAVNALEGLEGLRPVVASRAGEQHDHLRKGVLQFGHVPVFGTRAREFRARLFADPRVTAPATDRQQRITQITEQALGQLLMLLLGGLLEFMQGIGDQGDGMGETESITIQANLLGGLQHEGAHRVVAQEHAIELLLDPLGGLRAQRVVTEALVRIDVVDGGLDLPALVIAQDQVHGPHRAGIEQGGDQPMQFAMPWSLRILKAVFDDAHQQGLALLFAGVIFGIEVGQIGAITELAQVAGHDRAGQPPQHMGPHRPDDLDQARRVKAPIQQHQHAGLDRTRAAQRPPAVHAADRDERGHRQSGGWRIPAHRCRAPADRRRCHVGYWGIQRSAHWHRCRPPFPPCCRWPSAASRRQRPPASLGWHAVGRRARTSGAGAARPTADDAD